MSPTSLVGSYSAPNAVNFGLEQAMLVCEAHSRGSGSEVKLGLILHRCLWERGEEGGATYQEQARAYAVWSITMNTGVL